MADDTTVILTDGEGNELPFKATKDENGKYSLLHVQSIDGRPVSDDNPVPMRPVVSPGSASEAQQQIGNLALGAPTDLPWIGAGPGSMVAGIKAIWTKLGSVLNVNQKIGGADISSANPVPVTFDGAMATSDGQATTNLALGTKGDAAWSGTGDGTMVSVLKSLWTRLGSVLTTKIQVGGADVSTANPLPVTAPVGAASEALQTTANTALGTPTDGSWAGSGPGSINSVLKSIWSKLSSVLVTKIQIDGTDLGSANPMPVAIPSGLATEAGQSATKAAIGDQADNTWTGSGSGTLISVSKALWSRLGGVLTTKVQQGGQDLSGTNRLPVDLPTSAATTSNQEVLNTAIGAPADVAWSGTGTGSAVAILKGIWNKVGAGMPAQLQVGGAEVSPANRLPISLPTPLATETGQTSTNQALGAPTDVVWSGTGPASMIAALKAIWSRLGDGTPAQIQVGGQPISTTNPMPVTAATGASNSANQETLNASVGGVSDTPWSGTGNGTLVSVGKSIWSKLNSVLITKVQVGGADVSSTNPMPVTVPSGLATELGQGATNTSLGSVNETAWSGTGAGSLVSVLKAVWSRLGGVLTTKLQVNGVDVGAGNLLPVSVPATLATVAAQDAQNAVLGTAADAAWTGTGSSTLSAALKAIWTRLGTSLAFRPQVAGADLSSANPMPISLPATAATTANQTTTHSLIGGVGDAAWSGTGSGTMIAVLKGLWTRLGTTLSFAPQVGGAAVTAANPLPVVLPSGTIAVTLPAGTLDVKTQSGLATEAAQGTTNAVLGTVSDAVWAGTGNGTITAVLKSIWTRLGTTLSVTQQLGGQAISSTNPMPVVTAPGLATEGAQVTTNLALGTPTVAAWTTGSGSVISLLKATVGRLSGVLTVRPVGITMAQLDLTITQSTTEVLPFNADRLHATIINTGNFPVRISIGKTAAADQGVPLDPGDSESYDGSAIPTNVINAIAVGGPTTICVRHG